MVPTPIPVLTTNSRKYLDSRTATTSLFERNVPEVAASPSTVSFQSAAASCERSGQFQVHLVHPPRICHAVRRIPPAMYAGDPCLHIFRSTPEPQPGHRQNQMWLVGRSQVDDRIGKIVQATYHEPDQY